MNTKNRQKMAFQCQNSSYFLVESGLEDVKTPAKPDCDSHLLVVAIIHQLY